MSAPRNDDRNGGRGARIPHGLLCPRVFRVAALAVFGILVGFVMPFVFRSGPLLLALVVLLLVGGMFMLALVIYQAGRR